MLLLLVIISTQACIANTQQTIIEKHKGLEKPPNCSSETTLVDLSHNSISILANDSLSDCLALQTVNLDYNKIHNIESGTFLPLRELEYIGLSHNRINHIDHNVFANNEKLRTVILSHNPLVVPQLISPSLQNLVCDFCKRIEVNEDTFTAIPNVQTISLVGTHVLPFNANGLTALHSLEEFIVKDKHSKRCFLKHEYPTLVQLQQNNVTLGPNVFCRLNDCMQTSVSLGCKHMDLTSIDPLESNVIFIDYSYNLISRIANKTFASQDSIRILRLGHNLITNIENDAFRTLKQLKYVDLSYNKLEFIHELLFAENKNLLTVELSHNSIIVPHLQSNSIENLVCDFCKTIVVEENQFSTMPNLKLVRVLGTRVMPFDENAAETLPALREFVITRNDSRQCYHEEDYPGLLYLQERGVILGDDVFCKLPPEIVADSYSLTDDNTNTNGIYTSANNHAQRTLGTDLGLFLTCIVVFIFKCI